MVIGLPTNIFYGTSIPTCILVLKKQRKVDDNILFIDASAHFGKSTNQNSLREEDIERILNAVESRESKEKFSYVATPQEVRTENNFNLNIPRYVDTFDEEVVIDLKNVSSQLKQVESKIINEDMVISRYFTELNIANPFGES